MKRLTTLLLYLLISPVSIAQHMHQDNNELKAEGVNKENSLHAFDAEWTNHRGDLVKLNEFAGEAVILVMFYGNCTEVCPILIQDAWRLYDAVSEEVKPSVNVLAITFDPENDTPEVLKTYAEYEYLDYPGWHFVTTEPSKIREMAMLLGVQYTKKSDGHFAHSNLVTVLDGKGKIAKRIEGLGRDMSSATAWINEQFKTNN